MYKDGPSMILITIPCLLASIGTGVLNLFSNNNCRNAYSLEAANLDRYNQLKFFRFYK